MHREELLQRNRLSGIAGVPIGIDRLHQGSGFIAGRRCGRDQRFLEDTVALRCGGTGRRFVGRRHRSGQGQGAGEHRAKQRIACEHEPIFLAAQNDNRANEKALRHRPCRALRQQRLWIDHRAVWQGLKRAGRERVAVGRAVDTGDIPTETDLVLRAA